MGKKVVILGAGLAGLSVAYHSQNGCSLYEQESEVGGLARSAVRNGFIFDYDGHLLHFKTGYMRRLVERLLPGIFREHERCAWIYSHNSYTKYPFQANTYGLPAAVIKKCLMGMFRSRMAARREEEPRDFHEWMLANFGEGITRCFMQPYNEKFWNRPARELTAEWTKEYVPRVNVKQVIDGAFTNKTGGIGYNCRFWYPEKGGIEQLPQALAAKIKNVNLNTRIRGVDIKNKKVWFENGKETAFDNLVSTIPLPELGRLLDGRLPARVKTAFSRLKFISIYNINLGIARENINDKHWIYFPEKKFSFFRVGFPTNFSANVAPQGSSSLYAEVSYSREKPLKKDVETKVLSGLVEAGILNKEEKIIVRHINDIKYGYVVYDHDYRHSVDIITGFLRENGILCSGRFGRWQYMSMEDAVLDGLAVSEELKLL